jgi:hypothetical protein
LWEKGAYPHSGYVLPADLQPVAMDIDSSLERSAAKQVGSHFLFPTGIPGKIAVT